MKKIILIAVVAACGVVSNAATIIANRGEPTLRPQNTLSSFELAWENENKYVEGDFFSTKVGEIVCVHSQKELTDLYKEKKNLEEMSKFEIETCYIKSTEWKDFLGERLPTIDDVLCIVPRDGVLVVKIKKLGANFINKIEKGLKDNWLTHSNIAFVSVDFNSLVEVKNLSKDFKCLWIYDTAKQDSTEIFSQTEIVKKVKASGLDGVDVGYSKSISREYVSAFKNVGLQFWVWTVDDEDIARELIKMGVDGITTNIATKMGKSLGLH